jgi:hypothetical protein
VHDWGMSSMYVAVHSGVLHNTQQGVDDVLVQQGYVHPKKRKLEASRMHTQYYQLGSIRAHARWNWARHEARVKIQLESSCCTLRLPLRGVQKPHFLAL